MPSKVTAMDEDSETDEEEEDFLKMQINKPRKSTYKRATAYIFDDNISTQATSAPKKEFEFDVPQIDKTFEMDDDFVQQIDWEKERNNKNEYKDFLSTNQLRPDDSKPFLLPQVSIVFMRATIVNIETGRRRCSCIFTTLWQSTRGYYQFSKRR